MNSALWAMCAVLVTFANDACLQYPYIVHVVCVSFFFFFFFPETGSVVLDN